MSTGKLIVLLYIGLAITIVLLTVVSMILIIMIAAQKRSSHKLKSLRKVSIDLLLAYSHKYYVPLNGSIAQAYLSIGDHRNNPSNESASKTFYCYCCYLYYQDLLLKAGVPLPFEEEEQSNFLDYINKTLSLPGLSEAQRMSCITALTKLYIPCHESINFEQCKLVLRDNFNEFKSFENFLNSNDNKIETIEDIFRKLYSLLSCEIDQLAKISHILTPSELIFQILKDIWSEIRTIKKLNTVPLEPEIEKEATKIQIIIALTAILLGFIYIAIFLPLSWSSAKQLNMDPLNIILFAEMGPNLRKAFEINFFPIFTGIHALPTLFAIGTCIGFLMLSGAILLIADPVRVGVSVKGLVLAFGITTLLGYFIGTLPIDSVILRLFVFKFGYLIAIFAFLSCLPVLLGRKGIYKIKYEKMFNGFYGIIAGWLLTKGFGMSAAIYNSILFFISWFAAIAILERDPRLAAAPLLQTISLNKFAKCMWAERRSILPFVGLFILITILFHSLVIILYKSFLAGRF